MKETMASLLSEFSLESLPSNSSHVIDLVFVRLNLFGLLLEAGSWTNYPASAFIAFHNIVRIILEAFVIRSFVQMRNNLNLQESNATSSSLISSPSLL